MLLHNKIKQLVLSVCQCQQKTESPKQII